MHSLRNNPLMFLCTARYGRPLPLPKIYWQISQTTPTDMLAIALIPDSMYHLEAKSSQATLTFIVFQLPVPSITSISITPSALRPCLSYVSRIFIFSPHPSLVFIPLPLRTIITLCDIIYLLSPIWPTAILYTSHHAGHILVGAPAASSSLQKPIAHLCGYSWDSRRVVGGEIRRSAEVVKRGEWLEIWGFRGQSWLQGLGFPRLWYCML